jgi:hypothetical protein
MPLLLSLNNPVGSGQTSDPDDVYALDNALRAIDAYDPPPEYAAEPQRYATAPMNEALERFQEKEGLKVDGYANPGGPTERAINNRLLQRPRGAGLLYEPLTQMRDTVGNGFANDWRDVQNVKRGLGALGYLPEDPFDRPHGLIDEPATKAIERFQADNGLTVDGWLAPGGEAEGALARRISALATERLGAWRDYWKREADAQFERGFDDKSGDGDSVIPVRGGLVESAPSPPPRGSTTPRPGSSGRLGLWPEPIPKDVRDLIPRSMRRPPWSEQPGRPRRFLTNPDERLAPEVAPDAPNFEPMPRDSEPLRVEDVTRWMDEIDRGDLVAKYRYFPRLGQTQRPGGPTPGTIIITPPPGDELAIPIIRSERQYYGRTGSPETQEATRDFMWTIVNACKKVLPGVQVQRLGGPNEDPAAKTKEVLTSRLKRDAAKNGIIITTNKGGSFGDGTVLFEYKEVQVFFQFDTFTALRTNREPNLRERSQYARLEYNEGDRNSVLARMPKPFPGEEVDREALSEFAFRLCRKVKDAVDRGEMLKDPNARKKQIKDLFDKMIEAAEKQKARAKQPSSE